MLGSITENVVILEGQEAYMGQRTYHGISCCWVRSACLLTILTYVTLGQNLQCKFWSVVPIPNLPIKCRDRDAVTWVLHEMSLPNGKAFCLMALARHEICDRQTQKSAFLFECYRQTLQNLGLKPPILEKFGGKIKFWASIMSSCLLYTSDAADE